MSNRTAEGLRDRLFNALDLFIEKKVTTKEVEGICYLSEQILKTSKIELDFQIEMNKAAQEERDDKLRLKKEEARVQELLQIALNDAGDYAQETV